MAHMKLYRALLALLLLASAVTSVPIMPYSHGLMGMFGHGMFGGSVPGMYGASSGASYSGSTTTSQDSHKTSPHPSILVGTQRILDNSNELIEGFHIVIEPEGPSRSTGGSQVGGSLSHSLAGLFGAGLGGYGGLMGGYGGLMGGHSNAVPGLHQSNGLKATINIRVLSGAPTQELYLVFTEASKPGVQETESFCVPEEQGAILTSPPQGQGYGASMGLHHSVGGYLGMPLGIGHAGRTSGHGGKEEEYGIMATLTLHEGKNTFELRGLGPFNTIDPLAGRGANLCRDIVMGYDRKPACSNVGPDSVVFCAKLSYAINPGTLELPDPEDTFFDTPEFLDHPIL